jgi:hypothetical protein
MRHACWILAVAGTLASVGACARTPADGGAASAPRGAAARPDRVDHAAHATRASAAGPATKAGLPKVLVHRSPSCGCCGGWVEHMRRHGFVVDVHMTEDLAPINTRLGVPPGKGSCHTAEVGGFVVEGHVPAADVERLLAMRDGSRGLVLPGMPLGSPGMESPDGRVQGYTVERIGADGRTTPFATHGPRPPR